MKRRPAIPLSYNTIPIKDLARKLTAFEGQRHNDLVEDLEAGLRKQTGARYVVALNSGTAALHLGLKALHVQPDDRILVSTFTYVASVNPILYLNAVPVLVDCDKTDWNMDPELMEKAIIECVREGKKPKAIIVVHNFGMPARIGEILSIAARHGIAVLEDAAEAIGSTYKGKALGTWGEVGILSFNNNKTVTSFGGGALLTDDSTIAEKVLSWSTHSRKPLPYYEHEEVGFNYRMGPLNAAMGSISLEKAQENVQTRRRIFDAYQTRIGSLPGVNWQRELDSCYSNRWISCFVFDRDPGHVRQALDRNEIETRPLWNPMHRQPLFAGCKAFLNGTADQLYRHGLCLPSGQDLNEGEIERISSLVKMTLLA